MAKDPIIDKIITARVRMLLNAPFFGSLATRLKIIDGSDWVPTAATDGKHLYYNRDFFEKLDKSELEFVLAHEVMHCVYDHMSRRGGRDPRLWNCAGDFVINLELVEHGIGRLPDKVDCLYDKKYKGMSANEIYDLLKQDQENGNGDESMDSFDVHIEMGSGNGDNDSDGDNDGTGKSKPIPITEEEAKQLKDEIKQAVMQAAKAAGASNCPASVRSMIEDITNPQMDWTELLQTHLQSCLKSDYTFARPSRKGQGMGYILPGMKHDEKIDVTIAIDTSGSISRKMLMDFLGEVKGIMEQFLDFNLELWCFDTAVHNPKKFTPDNVEELLEYELAGWGGTDFDVNWEFMKEKGIEPNKFIMMTDGYPWNSWGDEFYCDTIFLIHGDKNIEAPFGTTCYYEENN